MPPKFSIPDDQQERNARSTFFSLVLVVLFLVLSGRLFYLQYLEYDENKRLSEDNRIKKIIVKAERGLILDRNKQTLVRNRPSYQIAILPEKLGNIDSIYNTLMSIRDKAGNTVFDSAHVRWTFERGRWRRFQPLRILEDASIGMVSLIEEHMEMLPGVVVNVESRRAYPYATMGAHVFGYTGEIDEEQLKKPEFEVYSLGDRIGKMGLESYYESYFKGHNGVKFYEVNAYGKAVRLLTDMPQEEPVPGYHLVTTLDLGLQKVAENAFPDSIKGAVVAIDPRNGEVLAMVSSPRIDPNIFSLEKRALAKEWAEVALDSDRPLNNRAVVGTYPPASVFKFVTAIAAAEDGVNPKRTVFCPGGLKFGRRFQKCWRQHGTVDLIDALRESCDTYFYVIGLELGMDKINAVGRRYGLGLHTGIDLPIEKRGLLMDSSTYNRRFKHKNWRWTRGQILNLSIGQGQLVTPLQMANMFGAMATNAGTYRPHLMKEIIDIDGNLIESYQPEIIHAEIMSDSIHALMIQAMEDVITGVRATGGRARINGIRVGGKTGSAENPHGEKTHAWFATAAPLEAPEIAIAIVMENAGGGGAVAAPIAGKMLKYYFLDEKERLP